MLIAAKITKKKVLWNEHLNAKILFRLIIASGNERVHTLSRNYLSYSLPHS